MLPISYCYISVIFLIPAILNKDYLDLFFVIIVTSFFLFVYVFKTDLANPDNLPTNKNSQPNESDKTKTFIPTVQATGLQKGHVICHKNHGHKEFTPAKLFSIDDLPKGYRKRDLYKYLRKLAGLVVKVEVSQLSAKRPPDFENSAEVHRENDVTSGSGILWNAQRCKWNTKRDCPCSHCALPGATPVRQWGQLCVCTANHVVYDNTEAQHTVVFFNYDDPGDVSTVDQMHGFRLFQSEQDGDSCEMAVVTHDRNVFDTILKNIEKCYNTKRKPSDLENLAMYQDGNYLCVIIAHPHGLEKQFSFGWTKYRDIDNRAQTGIDSVSYTYTTPTCPGSSGAPVFIVGNEIQTVVFAPHSWAQRVNRNISGSGLEYAKRIQHREKKSPFLYICKTRRFSKLQKARYIWNLINVLFRKAYKYIYSRLIRLPRRKPRKPTKKIVEKLKEKKILKSSETKVRPMKLHMENILSLNLAKLADSNAQLCPMRDKHERFLKVQNLEIASLPTSYQDKNILAIVSDLCHLVGLLYLPSDQLTCYILYRYFDSAYKVKTCPCPKCKKSLTPEKCWSSFIARTSYNFSTINQKTPTTCFLFYDNENDQGSSDILYFLKVTKKDKGKHYCNILLVTHDNHLSVKICKHLDNFRDSTKKVKKSLVHRDPAMSMLKAIPCHPHGLSKRISLGLTAGTDETKEEEPDDFIAAKCSGSEGAPVYTLNCQALVNCRVNMPPKQNKTEQI